jgi:hypothetical protein
MHNWFWIFSPTTPSGLTPDSASLLSIGWWDTETGKPRYPSLVTSLPPARSVYRAYGRSSAWERVGVGIMDKAGVSQDHRDYDPGTWSVMPTPTRSQAELRP